jgi:type I restriction enzyme M protein
MSSNQSGEGEIRKAIIEADMVDCMVALPGQLFYSTGIPVCLWFLTRNKLRVPKVKNLEIKAGFGDRRGQTLFIDARKMGILINRVHRELTEADILKIADKYAAWRGRVVMDAPDYGDEPGFCKSAKLDEIRSHSHILTPGRYVGTEDSEDETEPFDLKFQSLTARLYEQFEQSCCLEQKIEANLKTIAYAK